MTKQKVWIGAIGVVAFLVGLAIGITPGLIENATVEANIARFDDLDFEGYNKQNWELFNSFHSPDIVVTMPDGSQTTGIDVHDIIVKSTFDWAPDMAVTSHPLSIGSGDWTASIGILEGTFTEPLVLPDGTVIEPTGKHFKVPVATFAHWKDGRMLEERGFLDTAAMLR